MCPGALLFPFLAQHSWLPSPVQWVPLQPCFSQTDCSHLQNIEPEESTRQCALALLAQVFKSHLFALVLNPVPCIESCTLDQLKTCFLRRTHPKTEKWRHQRWSRQPGSAHHQVISTINFCSTMNSAPDLFVRLNFYQPNPFPVLEVHFLLLLDLHLGSFVRASKITGVRHDRIHSVSGCGIGIALPLLFTAQMRTSQDLCLTFCHDDTGEGPGYSLLCPLAPIIYNRHSIKLTDMDGYNLSIVCSQF